MHPDPWQPYEPTPAAPWDLRRVVHLHRRAGFAATWGEIQRDLADGPEASVTRLLEGTSRASGVPDGFESTATLLADAAVASGDASRLKAWWVYRMLFGPDPLGERLTLMWHDHFATSNLKVNDLALMHRQNETLREHSRTRFGELLRAVVRDPALLVWLDAPANRKGRPNENLARELMELFTLGIGHYGEEDIREAARALTGWSVENGRFVEISTRHDDAEKSILGWTGRWAGDDLLQLLLDQNATADRVAWCLGSEFLGEGVATPESLAALAGDLRENDLDVGRAVAMVLRSQAFFDEANLRSRVVAPVPFVVGAVRVLELFDVPPSTLVLADWAARLGQDLFHPPNVGGWPGGRAWLTTRAVLGRANYAAALAGGTGVGRREPVDVLALAARHGRVDPAAFLADLMLGGEPSPGRLDATSAAIGPDNSLDPDAARRILALTLASPEAQLG